MSYSSDSQPTIHSRRIFTIGHSTHSLNDFLTMLNQHNITAIADVRSSPYSRMNPQYNREELRKALKKASVAYVFLGDELGARSDDPECYENGKVRYERLARTPAFERGIDRVEKGAEEFRLALMCAEKEPLDCHRTILVSRYLDKLGIDVQHILADGALEPHRETIERLKARLKLGEDMFRQPDEVTREAYAIQGERIAYELPDHDRAIGEAGSTG